MIDRKEASQMFKRANVTFVGKGKDRMLFGVTNKLPKSMLSRRDIIPANVAGIPTDVIPTGKIVAMRTGVYRPAPGGVSIGHYAITAGTLGMLVLKDGKVMILSNNHVLANSNDAVVGDVIIQPGAYDGGNIAEHRIATLHSWVPIQFGGGNGNGSDCWFSKGVVSFFNGTYWFVGKVHELLGYSGRPTTRFKIYDSAPVYNKVDCALALPDSPSLVKNEVLELGVPISFGTVNLGDKVVKSGRTTGFTTGEVTALEAYVSVSYGSGKIAYFENQIITTYMLAGGDSGSILFLDDKKTVVGICFAGSSETSIMNPIDDVIDGLGGFSIVS